MMVPGGRDDWVLLTIEPGTTFLPEHMVTACSQAHLDGREDTHLRVGAMLWATAVLETMDGDEPAWPHEIAQAFADGFRAMHDEALERYGEEKVLETYEAMVVEMRRVLEQVKADIRAKGEAELRRMRVRRNA